MLLKFRLRSENEIRQRLKKKKFDVDIIEMTLSFLKDKGFIDDDYFAKTWIESRIKKPLGIRRLKAELSIKGINKAIIDTQINEIKKSYPEEDIVKGIENREITELENLKNNEE